MLRFFALALIALPLAACGDSKDGTSITLNASDTDGNFTAGMDKDGKIAINSPVFSGSLSLPKMHFNANDFDMNGVHLYPGSTISGMNIDAHDKPGKDDGVVKVSFQSPAAPDTVRDWFQQKLSGAGFTIKADGNSLSGTTEDKQPFHLDLAPNGTDKADGTLTIG